MSTRKIMNAKDLSTNELIYFRGHAKATYMSDGTTTVEDAINAIDISNVSAAYPIVNHAQSEIKVNIAPNMFHIWGEMSELSILFEEPENNSIANEYVFQFTSGATATTLTLPDLQWTSEPVINPSCTYQVSILNNCATLLEFAPLS